MNLNKRNALQVSGTSVDRVSSGRHLGSGGRL